VILRDNTIPLQANRQLTRSFFLLTIVLSVLLRYTDSDYPFGIFKLFLQAYVSIGVVNFLLLHLAF